MGDPRVSILLPTLNGEKDLERLLPALAAQQLDGGFEILAIDSDSDDGTRAALERAGARVTRIARADFGHGRTRNQCAAPARGEFLVFLSQDVVPCDANFLTHLVAAFDAPSVAGAYARILPHASDDPLTARTVLAAPEASDVPRESALAEGSTLADLDPRARAELVRFNDVASAIRRRVFEVLPFPDVHFGEDAAWAARALAAGHTIRFVPAACVHHAHRYGPRAAFARYRVDAAFQREQNGLVVRPSLMSLARGIAHEVWSDVRHVARTRASPLHLLRSPGLRGAQIWGQYCGSRAGVSSVGTRSD